ncbi:hypothetical protein Scep_028466 [Stephania cephalantha]|uniref:Helicase-like transcription factor CHR28 n=1 Tax=Stephania cephalantha TaxID=152367 RepID=A0AAP0HJL8_9MAGN
MSAESRTCLLSVLRIFSDNRLGLVETRRLAEENSDFWSSDRCGNDESSDNYWMDEESILAILSEDLDPSGTNFEVSFVDVLLLPQLLNDINSQENLFYDSLPVGSPNVNVNNGISSQSLHGKLIVICHSSVVTALFTLCCHISEVYRPSMRHHSGYRKPSDPRERMDPRRSLDFTGSFNMVEHEKPGITSLTESLYHSSASLAEWSTDATVEGSRNAQLHSNADSKTMEYYFPEYNLPLDYVAGNGNHASSCADLVDSIELKIENQCAFMNDGGVPQPKSASSNPTITNSANHNATSRSSLGEMETCGTFRLSLRDELPSVTAKMESQDVNQSNLLSEHEVSGTLYESSNFFSLAPSYQHSGSMADSEHFYEPTRQFLPYTYDFPATVGKKESTSDITNEVGEASGGVSVQTIMDSASTDSCQDTSIKWEDRSPCSANSFDADVRPSSNVSSQSLVGIPSLVSSKGEIFCIEDGRQNQLLPSWTEGLFSRSTNAIDVNVTDIGSPVSKISASGADHASSYLMHGRQVPSNIKPNSCFKKEEDKLTLYGSATAQAVKLSGEVWSDGSVYSSRIDFDADADSDADVCILEDISDPRRSPPVGRQSKSFAVVAPGKSVATSQYSPIGDSHHQTGTGGIRPRINNERLTYRAALQGLSQSQSKAEATPPDGLLAVPLLRHQRIALSWMMQKETTGYHCSGGILADDQGLGKTISTIALILKERPPSKISPVAVKSHELEALNLDDDDDSGVCQLDSSTQDGDSSHIRADGNSSQSEKATPTKGRPAAGTLVVCPTSVLRQWAEELHNKVTREANLSVLVYHGSNRTKDPLELAKYDVVLTTYSIVSMEVPKQPLVDKDDDDKVKQEGGNLQSVLFPSSKKRKDAPDSEKRSGKGRKGTDGALLEAISRPLARVGWFRVVLDEAQSIKNYRTQVARACWGLRAKRRWCLSGTPIQNAVDDLYSYFRFLRYDPYAAYKSFCSMIKIPINRDPTKGYKKLQVVLKTIMLRRTKGALITTFDLEINDEEVSSVYYASYDSRGELNLIDGPDYSFIDGQPIITLPPKSIELRKIDFSMEERDFYSKLEADSRAQFKVYAAAGTVKQNYVNILLMLLRLRQACGHPLLVRGYDSNSIWRSSVDLVKKLPKEKQSNLLSCLEASLAICGICNDAPEDPVVTICGHVYCNQCVCEHLTGDERLCPAAQCKVQLSITSVFSKETLKSSLFDQPDHNSFADNSTSHLVEAIGPFSEGLANSSKISAALEILQSISEQRRCGSDVGSDVSISKSCDKDHCDSQTVGSFKDKPNGKYEDTGKPSSDKITGKAIVFSQWTRMLDLLEGRLKDSSIQYRRLDGTMSVLARDKAVKDFNTLPEVSVMIMSLKAASLGLNMVAACHVLLLDLWWNPTTEDQAIDRAHRIGQTRPVTVVRLTVKDTVEDRILALQQKKREMVASAFGEDEAGGRQTRLTVEDLNYLFMV